MRLESVFGALGGWLLLHQPFHGRSLAAPSSCSGGLAQRSVEDWLKMPQRKLEVTRRTAAGTPYELTRKGQAAQPADPAGRHRVVSIPWSYTVGLPMPL